MDLQEVKTQIEELGKAIHAERETNDKFRAEVKERGEATAETLEKVKRIDDAIALAEEAKEMAEKTAANVNSTIRGGSDAGEKNLEWKEAFEGYLRTGDSSRLEQIPEHKTLVSSNGEDGGFYTRPEFLTSVINTNVDESSPVRGVARVEQISGNELVIPARNTIGASGGWVGEQEARAETTAPKSKQVRILVHEQFAQPGISQKLLDDAFFDIESWLATEINLILNITEASAFVNGDGVDKPRGFLTLDDGTGFRQIEQVASGENGTFGAASTRGDVFHTVQGKLKDAYAANAVWAMNRTTKADVRKIRDNTGGSGEGNYILSPGLAPGVSDQILGKPVVQMQDMPDPGTDSLSVIYSDFRSLYWVVDGVGIRVIRDNLTDKPNVLFYATKRTGGDVVVGEAGKIIKLGT